MKLELKHISAYLPYKLKVSVNHNEYIVTIDDEMDSDSICLTDVIENGHKLLLRQLSGLTKEIEVNGEKFIPIEYFEIGDEPSDFPYEFDTGNINLIRTLETISKHNVYHDVKYLPSIVVEKLHEWHFDTENLIGHSLAIDINTLNK